MMLMEKLDKIKIKETKTSNFILPLLGYPKLFYQPFLVNAYLNTSIYDIYKINILVRFYASTSFVNLEEGIKSMDTYIDSYDLYEGRYIMFMVEIPDKFKADFDKVLEGKYSKLSKEAKRLILKGRDATSSMPKVLSKDKSLKSYWETLLGTSIGDQEVWPKLELSQEVFIKEDFPYIEPIF